METAGFIIIIGVLFSFGAWLWYYASIGKRINMEEKSKEKNNI
jgi:hypothetical protein